jgi:hypothetical protein
MAPEMVRKKPGWSPNRPPSTPEGWLREIARAFLDAAETIPMGPVLDLDIKEADLFHMAPMVCLKFRGIRSSKRSLQKATDAALASYVATASRDAEALSKPHVAFAFSYLASHFGLDLLTADEVTELMDLTVDREKELAAATGAVRTFR